MGLMAARAGNRMGMRQGYRTIARMQRRRSFVEDKLGVRQDFQPARQQQTARADQAAAPAPAEPAYVAELQGLAQMRDQGIVTPGEFEAKKKQLLGI